MSVSTLTWGDIVNLIQSQGISSGLTQDQINAAETVAKVENGWSGIVGDNARAIDSRSAAAEA